MGFKTFGAETLLAADVNNYLMRQSVISVATTTAMVAIPSPQNGMLVYVESMNLYYSRRAGGWYSVFGYTDWQTIPLRSGFIASGGLTPKVRLNGNRVEFTGHVTKTGDTTGTAPEVWGDVTSTYRPLATTMQPVTLTNSIASCRAWAKPDGSVNFQASASALAVDISALGYPLT